MVTKKPKGKQRAPTVSTEMRYRQIASAVARGYDIKKVLKEQGYSESMIKNPAQITKKKLFRELLDQYLPDSFVLDQHKRLFTEHRNIEQIRLDTTDDALIKKATRGLDCVSVIKKEDQGYTLLLVNQVDRQARKDAADMAYKVRGAYSPTQIEVKREMEDVSDDDILALIQDNIDEG